MRDLSFRPTLLLISLLALAGCSDSDGTSGSAGPAGPLPALQAIPDAVEGGRIVDASGREVLLRGVNVNALAALRQAEEAIGAPRRLFLFEPTAGWLLGFLAPPFEHDDQVVYSPHIYQGGISGGTLESGFARAADEASRLYDGAPVLTGQWGSDPGRAADPDDDYFERHLTEQDNYRFGVTMWTWREACGDPHKYAPARDGEVPEVWGFFEVDCASNAITGPRTALTDTLRKMAVRYTPGGLSSVEWSPDDSALNAAGNDALESMPWFGGTLFHARATGGPWSIRITR